MTARLRDVLADLDRLPPEIQDEYAEKIRADLDAEAAFDRAIESTSPEQWERLLTQVRLDIAAHGTTALEDVVPLARKSSS